MKILKRKKSIGLLLVLSIFISLCLSGCIGQESSEKTTSDDSVKIQVGSLKGPTTMGLLSMMNSYEGQEDYAFTISQNPEELVGLITQGKVDIALIPANLASTLYKKTEGKIKAIDINTLGVLYAVSQDGSIDSFKSLEGKTIYSIGRGTTPEWVLKALASANKMDASQLYIEYKSEPTEVVAALSADPSAVGILPMPFAKAATLQNKALNLGLSLSNAWEESFGGNLQVTGVTIVRSEFLKKHPDAVQSFIREHKTSVSETIDNLDESATLAVKYGILEKEAIAKAVLPLCNIAAIDGAEMKDNLKSYYDVLYKVDPASVGGEVPEDGFYFVGN